MLQDAPKGEVAVEEQVAIRDLLERYCRYIDDCSSSKIADLFTEDAVLEAMGRRLVGRNEIVAFLPAEPGVVRERPVTQHLLSNVVIERSGQALPPAAAAVRRLDVQPFHLADLRPGTRPQVVTRCERP